MIALPINEASQVADARRRVAARAAALSLDEQTTGRAVLVASELATNLLKHGGGGQLLVGPDPAPGGDADDPAEPVATGLVLIALDRGPGLSAAACMVDGFSTAGTLGHGLGAVRRQSEAIAIASWPGAGTGLLARIGPRQRPPGPPPGLPDVGWVVLPKPGESACGDAVHVHRTPAATSYFMVDGLGHGSAAARAAHLAVLQARRSADAPPGRVIEDVHRALATSRGGAVALARHDRTAGLVGYAGLGNIAGALYGRDGKLRRMVSHNGTAGHNARRIQTFDYPGAGGLLVMHSDGIDSRWSLDRYPGALAMDPQLLAALIYRDHGRGRDDATVLVARL